MTKTRMIENREPDIIMDEDLIHASGITVASTEAEMKDGTRHHKMLIMMTVEGVLGGAMKVAAVLSHADARAMSEALARLTDQNEAEALASSNKGKVN